MIFAAALAIALSGAPGVPSPAAASAVDAPRSDRVTAPAELSALVARATARVPSYARQTKLGCGACHYGFPQLTPFGRLFKLNGYTLTGLSMITEQTDSTARKALELSPIAPLSAMAVVSMTQLGKEIPGTQNGTVQFPQQFSLFLATQIAPKGGIFSQFTYEQGSGTFGIDNTDIRFANHGTLNDRDFLYGVTLHNNPTVQDVWNSSPAWGFPFIGSNVAPGGMASTIVEGALAQSVVGAGLYSMYDNLLYTEFTAYRSAPQGVAQPLDSSSKMVTSGVAPYWRVGLQHQFGSTYAMVGTYGLSAELYPTGITGTTNHYTDVGVDAQIEHAIGKSMLIGRANYIHESQALAASLAAGASQNVNNSLDSYKVNLSFAPDIFHTITVGYFGVSGSNDPLLYAPGAVTGSATGNPNTQGEQIELAFNPWLNTRFGLQYVMYQKFNGASNAYDIAGAGARNAQDNNALYLYMWVAF